MSEVHRPPSAPDEMPLKVVIVDISEHRRQLARDSADARLNDETAANYSSRWDAIKSVFTDPRGTSRRVWKGNVFREYYQQKYYRQELDRLENSDNLYAHEDGDDRDALVSVVDRFASDYDEVIHTGAGERRDILQEGDATTENLRSSIKDLIRDFASGTLDADAFEEEKNRICAMTANGNQDRVAGGLLYADNLLEIAENVRAAAGHGRAVEEIIADMQIVTGEARMGARTEARFNRIDKIVDKLSSSRIGSLIPEATIASAVAVASGFIKYGSQKALSMALAVTGALGVTGGVLGALRESKRIKQDRALHMRERALGKEFNPNAKRRGELEATRYETVGANDLRARLDSYFDGDNLREMSSDEYMQATSEIAAIMQRIKYSDEQRVDLIHFSSLESVEDERFGLDLSLARTKVAMNAYLATQGDDFLPAGLRVRSFDALVHGHTMAARGEIESSIDSRDAVFATLRRKEVLKAAGKAFGWGMVFGATAQEITSHVPGNDSYAGLGESHDGTSRTTTLHALLQGRETVTEAPTGETLLVSQQSGEHASIRMPDDYRVTTDGTTQTVFNAEGKSVASLELGSDGRFTPQSLATADEVKGVNIISTEAGRGAELSGQSQTYAIDGQPHSINIPKEYSASHVTNPDGTTTVSIFDQGGEKVSDVQLASDGSMTPESIASMEATGLTVDDAVDQIEAKTTTTVTTPEEVLWNTSDQATKVQRTLWYGNDTPGVYDQNELRAHAGGVNGDWFDAEGNVVIDITPMQPDGSYWQGQSANPWELADSGQLKAGISLSKGTQDFVYDFEFKRTSDGRLLATIPSDSPAHQLFEVGNEYNGHGAFNGRYVEIMEFAGENDPTQPQEVHMLATYVGQNDAGPMSVVTDTTEPRHTYTVEATTYTDQTVVFSPEAPASIVTTQEVTPITPIPVFGRRGLEKMRSSRSPENTRGGYEYYSATNDQESRWRRERSPRLQRNPDADLIPGEELSWYRSQLLARRGQSYLDEVDGWIQNSDILSNVNASTKAIVVMPVAAINESENIYNALRLYAEQSAESKDATVVLLSLNWIEKLAEDPANRAKIDKTIAEVERARRDFPDLQIATIQKAWDQELIDRRTTDDGRVRLYGEVIKTLYDAAALTIEKSIADGRRAAEDDALIITNDADALGITRNYLDRYISQLDESPDSDAYVGLIRWGTDTYGDYPGYGVSSGFMQLLNMVSARKKAGYQVQPATIGPNSAFKLSAYAAVGGCEDTDTMGAGADSVLGRRIWSARNPYVGTGRGMAGYLPSVRSRLIRGRFTSSRHTIKHVGGAQVDSAADRLLGAYREGKWLPEAWGSFDNGGYTGRDSAPGTDSPENPKTDADAIASRIARQISDFGTWWYPDPALVSWGLHAYFNANKDKKGHPIYQTKWIRGDDGPRLEFEFTPSGKKWLKTRLQHDTRGRFDPYGTRARRKLYSDRVGKDGKTDKKRARAIPRMVSA